MKKQKTLKVLNDTFVLENIVKDVLDASLSPEVELRCVFLEEGGFMPGKRVRRAMEDFGVLVTVAQRVCDLLLKDLSVGKNYIMEVVQVYLEIFQDGRGFWVETLAKDIPVQLLVVAEEKVRR